MATIPRTYFVTSKSTLDSNSIQKKNGQIIAVYDADEVWYDLSASGSSDPDAQDVVRRKISGVRVVSGSSIESAVPEPMEDIIYVYLGNDSNPEYLPINPQTQTQQRLYELYTYKDNTWFNVSNNTNDINVMTVEANVSGSTKYYLTFTSSDINYDVTTLSKVTDETSGVYLQGDTLYAPNFNGTVNEAIHAQSATNADNAIYDSPTVPKKKIQSYLNSVTSNATGEYIGTTLTFTRGDGTSISVNTKDTTYSIFTASSDGLVPKSTTISDQPSSVLLTSVGWKNASDIVMPAADSATKDGLGQNIADTYIKGLSWNSGTLTITAGDGDTSTISVPDTTYSVFTTSTDGLVPKASGTGDTAKFLRGDHTWQSAITPSDIFVGTTAGLVPSSTSGVNEKFLRSDGSWFGTFDNDEDGLVPKTNTAQATDILHANGTWSAESDTKNTAGSTQITSTQAQSPLYLIGAESQAANPQTYSDVKVYAQGNKLYSNNVEVVNLSDSQALTNKSYNGYILASACELTAGTSVTNDNTSTPTGAAVITYVSSRINSVQQDIDAKADQTVISPIYDDTATYPIDSYVMYDDGNGAKLYKCNTAISTPEAFDPNKWDNLTVMETQGKWLSGTLTAGSTSITLSDASITANSHIEVWADNGNVNYTNISSTTGSVTVTFLAQASNMTVEVRVF